MDRSHRREGHHLWEGGLGAGIRLSVGSDGVDRLFVRVGHRGFDRMGSSQIKPNQRGAGNGAITYLSHIGRSERAVPDHGR